MWTASVAKYIMISCIFGSLSFVRLKAGFVNQHHFPAIGYECQCGKNELFLSKYWVRLKQKIEKHLCILCCSQEEHDGWVYLWPVSCQAKSATKLIINIKPDLPLLVKLKSFILICDQTRSIMMAEWKWVIQTTCYIA